MTSVRAATRASAPAAAGAHPQNPASPHGTVYVTERGATPGTAAAFDAATGQVLWKTDVGQLPIGIVHPRGAEKVYTSDEGSNQMTVLERRTGKVIRTIAMGPQPHLTGREARIGAMPDTLQLTGDGDTLVVALRGTPAQIALMDTRSLAVRTVDIPGHNTTGHHWLSADSRFTFVAAESAQGPGSLAVVNNAAAALVADYPYPGGSRPHGVFAERRGLGPPCTDADLAEDRGA